MSTFIWFAILFANLSGGNLKGNPLRSYNQIAALVMGVATLVYYAIEYRWI